MNLRPARCRTAGFTLIELLVVIAIIAILAAILFPVFASAREKGRQTVCLSNLKQISSALILYRSDYDGRDPGSAQGGGFCTGGTVKDSSWPAWAAGIPTKAQSPVTTPPPTYDPVAQWVPCYTITLTGYEYNPVTNKLSDSWKNTGPKYGALFPYVKNAQVYICPSDPYPIKMLSYSMNAIVDYMPESMVQRPAQFDAFIDEQTTVNDGYFYPPLDCPTIAHNQGVVLAFFDGHAKWFRANKKPTQNNCYNSIKLSLFCPAIPFAYAGYDYICSKE